MNRSECIAPVNSSRSFSTAGLSYSASYLANYNDPGAHTVTRTVTQSTTWGSAIFPRNGSFTAPGTGQFYVTQQCCCWCRSRFVFDDSTYNDLPASAGTIITPIVIQETVQGLDAEGNPSGDPEQSDFDAFADLRLWMRDDAPCRSSAGYHKSPLALLYVPAQLLDVDGEDQFNPDNGDSITLSVSGSYGLREDTSGQHEVEGYRAFIFDSPSPCASSMSFDATITKTWVINGFFTANSSIAISFFMS